MDCKVFQYRGSWWRPVDALTMLATKSVYSHCGLWFERNDQQFIVEVTRAGPAKYTWGDYPWRGRCDLWDIEGMDEQRAFEVHAWVMGPEGPLQRNVRYDFVQVLGIGALIFDACLPEEYNPLDSSRKYICTEVIRRGCESTGMTVPGPRGYDTPQTFIDSGFITRVE